MRVAGALFGVALALVLLVVSRPGAASSPLPASVRFGLAPNGELELTPAPPSSRFLHSSLRPGGRAAEGNFAIRNQTGTPLAVRLRAKPNSPALNGLLRVELRGGGAVLADTTLQGLSLHPPSLRLGSGQRLGVHLRAWIPADVLNGYEGRLVGVSLVTATRAIGVPR